MNFDINNFSKRIICESAVTDTEVETVVDGNKLDLYVTATNDKVKFIELEWDFESGDGIYVMGDAWERSYGELEFKKLADNERVMPWYFIATDKTQCFCFGVKTQPNAFISFRYTADGIKALVDCRNGSHGVELGGRKLHVATFVYKKYSSADIFANLHDYCTLAMASNTPWRVMESWSAISCWERSSSQYRRMTSRRWSVNSGP